MLRVLLFALAISLYLPSAAQQVQPQPINPEETIFRNAKDLLGDTGAKGTVQVAALISAEGSVANYKIMRSPSRLLTKAVEERLRVLKFVPGSTDGVPTPAWVKMNFTFTQ